MVQLSVVESQLKDLGLNFRFFGRAEVHELAKILSPGEAIAQALNGYYENGFALLCVTDHRLLLIDRKPLFLTLEDIRFDMVSEVDFNHRLLNAMIRVYTPNKSLVFTSWNHKRLRILVEYLQEQVMKSRQQQQYLTHEQFTHFAQAQFAAAQTDQRISPINIIPALARTALQGTQAAMHVPGNMPLVSRFVAPLSKNPYTKTPLLSRRRRYPNL